MSRKRKLVPAINLNRQFDVVRLKHVLGTRYWLYVNEARKEANHEP